MVSNEAEIEDARTETEDLSTDSDLKLRERYLLERDRIKQQIGNLRQILEVLGVNQRRACQLLLVDPSAWTRWNKTEAPPHIYQALKWLVMLKKTSPSLVGSADIETRLDLVQSATQSKLKELERNVSSLERALSYQPVAISSSNDSVQISELFQAQEERLQKRISELEMEVKRLSEKSKIFVRSSGSSPQRKSKKTIEKKLKPKLRSKLKSSRQKIRKKSKSPKKRKPLLKKVSRLSFKSLSSGKKKNHKMLSKIKRRKRSKN